MESIEKIVITELHSVLDVINPLFKHKKKQNRSVHGLCFTLSGEMVYYHGGKEIHADRRHALLIPKGATYTYSCTRAGEFPLVNFDTDASFAPKDFILFEINNPEEFMADFRELERISLIKPRNGHLKAMRILYSTFGRLHKMELAKETKNFHIIRPAVRYLENNFSDAKLTNKTLASEAMISEVYFRKIFKENYGVSPKQYIQELRIEKAKALLKGNNLTSIARVAEEVGFSNVYQFSAAFKKATGYTPTQFAKTSEEM